MAYIAQVLTRPRTDIGNLRGMPLFNPYDFQANSRYPVTYLESIG